MNSLNNCFLLLAFLAPFGVCFLPPVSLIVYYPLGLKACMKHERGIQEFSFYANVNKNITIWRNGEIEGYVKKPVDGYWCFVEKKTKLRPGDVLSYWYKAKKGFANIAAPVTRKELTQSHFLDDYNTENLYLKFVGKVETFTKPVNKTRSTTTEIPLIEKSTQSFNTSDLGTIGFQINDHIPKVNAFSILHEITNETIKRMNAYSPHIINVTSYVTTTPRLEFNNHHNVQDEFDPTNDELDLKSSDDLPNPEPTNDVPDPEPIYDVPDPDPILYTINFKPKMPIITATKQLDESNIKNTSETTTQKANQNETVCLCENTSTPAPYANERMKNMEKQLENLRLLEFENRNLKADLEMYKNFTKNLITMYESKIMNKNNKLILFGRSPSSGERGFLIEILKDILDIPPSDFTIVSHERINKDQLVFELKTFKEKINILILAQIKLAERRFGIADYDGNSS
ncbi:uncharacterized protein LOC143909477 [Arctopsyche grandis]|uniref:uncharacterized protein LOC143909477 n=1 Tax=Arctopsyche grandis TaxID=121162 RepID=UPI00406DA395